MIQVTDSLQRLGLAVDENAAPHPRRPDDETGPDRIHHEFVDRLEPEEYQLLVLRDELYDGSWEDMRRDLEDRKDGKPFIYKLVNRIEEDLKRIERLSAYEERENINLGEYLDEA